MTILFAVSRGYLRWSEVLCGQSRIMLYFDAKEFDVSKNESVVLVDG